MLSIQLIKMMCEGWDARTFTQRVI
jgi:hypothetical protein